MPTGAYTANMGYGSDGSEAENYPPAQLSHSDKWNPSADPNIH